MLTRQAQEIFGEKWPELEDDIVPVDVTPIARWFSESAPNLSLTNDMAQIVPPWPLVWVEYVTEIDRLKRVGVEVFYGEEGFRSFGLSERDDISIDKKGVASFSCTLYTESTREVVRELGTSIIFLDEDGFPLTSETLFKPSESLPDFDKQELKGALWLIKPILFGFSLCHANNVEVYDDEVPEPVQKKRRKSGKNPGKTFKCLDIEPMKEQSRRESDEGESDVERALHICRGHFKTYTEENPLFGKHTGTFWWPMHKRGSADAGEVEKSYRVNEPNNN